MKRQKSSTQKRKLERYLQTQGRMLFILLQQSLQGWQNDNAPLWSGALAYYSLFSLGPLLFIIISVLGLFIRKSSVENNIYLQMEMLIGKDSTLLLKTMMIHAAKSSLNIAGISIGTFTLIVGVGSVFGQLQQMFNSIWGVTSKKNANIVALLKRRLLNFSLVGVILFLLLISFIASAVIATVGTYIGYVFPFSPILLESLNFILSFVIITLLFSFILKVLPDVRLNWRNLWPGSIITALFFTIGKTIIGIYIGRSGIASQYGAATSIVIVMLWIYYSSLILFFGVEFTKAYTLMREKTIIPNEHAVLVRLEPLEEISKKEKLPATVASGFTKGFMEELFGDKSKKKK